MARELAILCIFLRAIVYVEPKSILNESFAVSGVYQFVTKPLNCTQYIPDGLLAYMQNTTPSATDFIPFSILPTCLLESDYNPSVPAFFFNNSSLIVFGISVSEVVSFDFNGDLQVKVSLNYFWNDDRLRWPLHSGVNNWMCPDSTILQVSQVWPLIFEVLSCPLQDCELRPQNHTYVYEYLDNIGTVTIQMSVVAFAFRQMHSWL